MKKVLLYLVALLGVSFCSFAEDVYIVAGNYESIFGSSWDGTNPDNVMSEQSDGTFTKTYTVGEAISDIQLKVVKNKSEWIGDEGNNNVTFNMKAAGDFTVVLNAEHTVVSVTGENVSFATSLDYNSVFAVGNGSGVWLNGITWNPSAPSNAMAQVSPDVWECLYKDVPAATNLQVKFAIDGGWAKNFGGSFVASGEATPAVRDGGNITFDHPGGDIRLHLDLSGFDFKTKQGATFTITLGAVEPSSNFEVLDPVVQMGTYLKFEARNAKNNYKYILDSYEWTSDKGPQLQLTIEPLDASKPAAFTAEDLADENYWEPLFRKYTAMIAGQAMEASDNIKKLFITDVAILPSQFCKYPDGMQLIDITASGDYEIPANCFSPTSSELEHFSTKSFECKIAGNMTIGESVFPVQKTGGLTIYCYREEIAQAWYDYKVANQHNYTVFLNGELYEGNGVELTGADIVNGNGIRYNVMGQRVNNDYKGIVIVDGKKFIVR